MNNTTNTATDYFTKSEIEMVACPACSQFRNCKLCSNARRVYQAMAAVYTASGVKAAWAWFNAKLEAKIGHVYVWSESKRVEVSGYVLRDENKPDTYDNRKWYQATVTYDGDFVSAVRSVFGNGRLRETTDYLDQCNSRRSFAVLR